MTLYIHSLIRRLIMSSFIEETGGVSASVASFPKFDLFQQPEYLRAQAHAAEYATSPPIINHYGRYICLKPLSETGSRPSTHRDTIETAFKQIEPFITNTLDEITGKIENKLCILPKGHSGKCMSKCHNNLFKKAATAAASTRFGTKIDQAIYTTPGNDGIIYKNRHDRGFPIVVSSANERLIKEYERTIAVAGATATKRSCAIPLCERSTPLMMATAYLDFMSSLLNIEGIDEYVTPDENLSAQEKEMIAFLQNTHKLFLDTFYRGYNRRIFADRIDGGSRFTRCAVRRYTFTPRDFVDTTRDSRFDISQNDIQIGHIVSRSDSEYTIRGLNVLFMSRRGNLIIGEENYLEEGWRDTLRGCLE
jgi:hypothetical protein